MAVGTAGEVLLDPMQLRRVEDAKRIFGREFLYLLVLVHAT